MLNPIEGLSPDVVAVSAEGAVTAEDYAEHLVPAIERVLGEGRRPRLLYVLGPSFERFELGAMVADAKVGVSHLTDFERIAVVTDHDWIDQMIRAFGVVTPCPVRTFGDNQMAAARAWIEERPADDIHLEVEREGNLAQVRVQLRGALDRDAEDQLVRALSEGIGDADELRVLIEAAGFHGWRDLRSVWQHLRFVAGQRRKLERVAIVGDARWQRRLVASARHLLRVDARFFEEGQVEAAREWLAR